MLTEYEKSHKREILAAWDYAVSVWDKDYTDLEGFVIEALGTRLGYEMPAWVGHGY